jgi:MFS family permease
MSWSSLGSPAFFALIGSAMPSERRTLGFSWQSLVKRLPMVIAPALGGILIARRGIIGGVRFALAITILMAITAFFLQRHFYLSPIIEPSSSPGASGAFRSFSPGLKRLLLCDIFARLAEGIAEIFIVLYAINHLGFSPKQFGILVGIQMATAIAGYLPAAAFSNHVGRKMLVFFTFTCFACFPLAVVLAKNFAQMAAAFVLGGLREFGEPARKSMIVNFAAAEWRGRHVGLYYLIRNLSVTPAAIMGGVLWREFSPRTTFHVAFLCGLIGTLLFLFSVHENSLEVAP